jgi:tetratricopeptide (TPR) repeat protein
MYRLSWILGTHPDANIHNAIEARDLANKGIELTHGKEAAFHDSLGAALAQLGKYEEALAAAEKALEFVPGGEQGPLAQGIKVRIELYKQKAPYRELPPTQ